MSKNREPARDADEVCGRGMVVLTVCLAVASASCKSDPETAGGPTGAESTIARAAAHASSEPAVPATADRGARKSFDAGRRAVLRRDFSHAWDLFQDALRRHRAQSVRQDDEFVRGCFYYFGRCREGALEFDDARKQYEAIPADSSFRPYALQRLVAISEDSDGDGYVDAWEDAEGSNPRNPLSHP